MATKPNIKEAVKNPTYYGGVDNPYEVIKVCEAWGLDKDAYLFNVVKYVARAGKKDDNFRLTMNGRTPTSGHASRYLTG